MARVHGLEHVERFFASDFADDDAVGTHTKSVDDQIPDLDRPVALDISGPGFHPRHVCLAQAKFGGVLDGDDPLVLRNIARKHVQKCRLTAARAAGDNNVQPCADAGLEQFQHALGQSQFGHQVLALQQIAAETAN